MLGIGSAGIAELKLRMAGGDADEAAMHAARELDADEVGKRADRRKAEREAQVDREPDPRLS